MYDDGNTISYRRIADSLLLLPAAAAAMAAAASSHFLAVAIQYRIAVSAMFLRIVPLHVHTCGRFSFVL